MTYSANVFGPQPFIRWIEFQGNNLTNEEAQFLRSKAAVLQKEECPLSSLREKTCKVADLSHLMCYRAFTNFIPQNSPFDLLPQELLLEVTKRLPLWDFARFMQTCKKMALLQKHLVFEDAKKMSPFIETLSYSNLQKVIDCLGKRRFSTPIQLDEYESPLSPRDVVTLFTYFPDASSLACTLSTLSRLLKIPRFAPYGFETIHLVNNGGAILKESDILGFTALCPRLTSVRLESCNIKTLKEVVNSHPNLRELYIKYNQLSNERELTSLVSGCKDLRVLHLEDYIDLTDFDFPTTLEELHLSWAIPFELLKIIFSKCPHLRSIRSYAFISANEMSQLTPPQKLENITFGPESTMAVFKSTVEKLPHLRRLDIIGMRGLTAEELAKLPTFEKVEELRVNNCDITPEGLTILLAKCPHIKKLRLTVLKFIHQITSQIALPRTLTHLNLTKEPIDNPTIARLLHHCPHLQKFVL